MSWKRLYLIVAGVVIVLAVGAAWLWWGTARVGVLNSPFSVVKLSLDRGKLDGIFPFDSQKTFWVIDADGVSRIVGKMVFRVTDKFKETPMEAGMDSNPGVWFAMDYQVKWGVGIGTIYLNEPVLDNVDPEKKNGMLSRVIVLQLMQMIRLPRDQQDKVITQMGASVTPFIIK